MVDAFLNQQLKDMELCKGLHTLILYHFYILIYRKRNVKFAFICLLSMSFTLRRQRGLSHLQAFDLCPLILQLGLQLTDLGLLTAHKRLFHHGLFLEL